MHKMWWKSPKSYTYTRCTYGIMIHISKWNIRYLNSQRFVTSADVCMIYRGMQKAADRVDWDDMGVCRTLRKTYGLDPRQARICKTWRPVMRHVSRAAALAAAACQTVLQNRRWNCSSVRAAPGLTPELLKGCITRFVFIYFHPLYKYIYIYITSAHKERVCITIILIRVRVQGDL